MVTAKPVNFTRPFTIFYIICANLLSISISWTIVFFVCDFHNNFILLLCINLLTSLFLGIFNIPFGFPFLTSAFQIFAPLFYWIFWETIAKNSDNYRDPLSEVIVIILLIIWSVRKWVYWLRSWRLPMELKESYREKFPASKMTIYYESIAYFFVLPLCILLMYAPMEYVVFREESLDVQDLVGMLLGLSVILWDSFAEQQYLNFKKIYRSTNNFYSGGIYRYVRHPRYTGMLIFPLILILFSRPSETSIYLSFTGFYIYYIHIRIWEIPNIEKYLMSVKPEYRKYRKNRAPIFPIPWIKL